MVGYVPVARLIVLLGRGLNRHRIVFQLICQFVGSANVKLVGRRAVKFLPFALGVQRVPRGVVGDKELFGRPACNHQLPELGDNDGPTEQRQDQQRENGNLAFGGRVLDGIYRRVGGEQRLNEHGGHRRFRFQIPGSGIWVGAA